MIKMIISKLPEFSCKSQNIDHTLVIELTTFGSKSWRPTLWAIRTVHWWQEITRFYLYFYIGAATISNCKQTFSPVESLLSNAHWKVKSDRTFIKDGAALFSDLLTQPHLFIFFYRRSLRMPLTFVTLGFWTIYK